MRLGVLDIGANTAHLLVTGDHLRAPAAPLLAQSEWLPQAEVLQQPIALV